MHKNQNFQADKESNLADLTRLKSHKILLQNKIYPESRTTQSWWINSTQNVIIFVLTVNVSNITETQDRMIYDLHGKWNRGSVFASGQSFVA